jgi:elongation factor G
LPILYEPIVFPEPVVSLALEPLARADGEALSRGVALLLEDDPSLRALEDRETGRVVISGMGELHLEVAVERLRSEQGIRLRAGAPQVSCREALRQAAEASIDFDRDMNGERVRAKLALRLAPRPRGSGGLVAAADGLRLPEELLSAVRRGVEASVSVGPTSSWPVEDYEATLLSYVAPASRQAGLALEIAASMAARDCLSAAGSTVLEPWMQVEIELPEDCLGPALAALSGRGGRVESIASVAFASLPGDGGGDGESKLITGSAALASLFGFTSELRSATAGRASWQGKFASYEPERSKKNGTSL